MLNANSKKVLNILSELAHSTGENSFGGMNIFETLAENGFYEEDAETAMKHLELLGYLRLDYAALPPDYTETILKRVRVTETGKDLKGFRRVALLQYARDNWTAIIALAVSIIALSRTF